MENQVLSLTPWKNYSKKDYHKLHSLCSYMAMFPPSLPNHFIKKYSKEGESVFDPFSGRGTTVLEACLNNRVGIGNDRNPLAFLLTKVKSNPPSKQRILSKIDSLEREFDPEKIDINQEKDHIRMLFHDSTLKQLIFLRSRLDWKNKNLDAFISAIITGSIHGGSESYFSISMPSAFSMSPNYIKKYIQEHNLEKPRRDVFNILRKKVEKNYQKPLMAKGKAYNLDVANIYRLEDSSVDLIITSPPYTKVIKYGQFNWIRLWFLGKNARDVDKKLFFTQSLIKYRGFMFGALEELKRVLKPRKKLVLVIGDIKEKNLAQDIWENCAKPLGFKLMDNIEDKINDNSKVSKIWGQKRGNVTKIDRILVLEK